MARRIIAGLAVVASIALPTYVALNEPGQGSIYPPCVFNMATGLYCPGCGGTRALHLALNGDLIGAARQNLLVVLALPLAMFALFALACYAVTGRSLFGEPLPTRVLIAVGLIVLVFSVLRNLPPFHFLAPTSLG